ncbi:hypothetical protein BGZ73_008335 [Actinomortierella ambigua]|nr:hypothetical protein BGZ73_008335 [Actinomortierella ambigua]
MDHFVQRTTQHHSPRHSYQRPPRPPVAQETLMSSASTSSADASGGNAFTSFAVQPLSDVASMHEQDHDNDDHDHDHGIDTLIDSLPESVLRKVLKSVAHLSTIQEALSTASTLSAPSSPAFDSSLSASSPSSAVPTQASPSPSAEATELRATSSVGTVSRLDSETLAYHSSHRIIIYPNKVTRQARRFFVSNSVS